MTLTIRVDDIIDAFETTSDGVEHYLNTETGELIFYSEYDDFGEEPLDLDAADYIRIPSMSSSEAYEDMELFVDTVTDQRLQHRLRQALMGRGPFRRFKNVLYDDLGAKKRWFAFKRKRLAQLALDWIEAKEFEATIIPATFYTPPSSRPKMIEGAFWFVQQASQLNGISRIALIGSLATEKEEPKDVDMLVTIIDAVDMEVLAVNMETLATLGRKFAGRLQQINRGAEVFLADSQGNYLGRTCPWKVCGGVHYNGAGVHYDCNGQQCGSRIRADFSTIRLKKSIIRKPPLVLWPNVVALAPVPKDVQVGLVEKVLTFLA